MTVTELGRGQPEPVPRQLVTLRSPADRAYRRIAQLAGLTTFGVLFLVGLFLFLKGWRAFETMGFSFFTTEAWRPDGPHPTIGVLSVLYWTVVIAVIALVLATPLAIGTALCINEYAPGRSRRIVTSVIDLLAAIPSVIYGYWGLLYMQPHLQGIAGWMARHLSFLPIFSANGSVFTSSALMAGIVVGIMVLPIVTSISREVFSLAPAGEREGALALGATRWDVIRRVVLPFGRAGVIGGVLLGLGRALGETIAIAIIISPIFVISPHILQPGANSVAALIALRFGTGGKLGTAGLLAAGFTLFVFTLVVNLLASFIINRSRSAKGVEL